MRSLLLATAALFMAAPAYALPTIGLGDTLNVVGNATYTGTTASFTTPADLVTGTGAYTALGTCTGCVTVNTPLQFSPFTNLANLFTAVNNGITATVSLTSQVLPPTIVGNDLTLNDDAILTLTGYAPTLGTIDITINQATGIASGSFSATAQGAPVAEPFSLAILGVGLLGLLAVKRRPV